MRGQKSLPGQRYGDGNFRGDPGQRYGDGTGNREKFLQNTIKTGQNVLEMCKNRLKKAGFSKNDTFLTKI